MTEQPHSDSAHLPRNGVPQPTTTVTPQELTQLWEYAAGDTIKLHRSRNASAVPLEYSTITPDATITTASADTHAVGHEPTHTQQPNQGPTAQTTLSGATDSQSPGRARYRHGTGAPSTETRPRTTETAAGAPEHAGQTSVAAVDVIPNPLPVDVSEIATVGHTRLITATLPDTVATSLPQCVSTVTITVTNPLAGHTAATQFKPASSLPLPVVNFSVDPTTSPRNTTYLPPIAVTHTDRVANGEPEYRHPAVPTSGGVFSYMGRRVHLLLDTDGTVRAYSRIDNTEIAESLDTFDRTAPHTRLVAQLSLPEFRQFVSTNDLQPRSSRAGNALETW